MGDAHPDRVGVGTRRLLLSPKGLELKGKPARILGAIDDYINIVGTEFLINYGGLGQLIEDLAERYDLAGTYAAIGFVILVSVVFFMALERVERWLRPVD